MKRILYLQYTNPGGYPPLEHSSKILADSGWQIVFLGVENRGSKGLEFPRHPNISVKKMGFVSPGIKQKFHYLLYSLWVLFYSLWWRPKWIYASDLFSCPPAVILSFIPGFRVIYHEHDSPPLSPSSLFIKINLKMREILAGQARICILPNHKRREIFCRQNKHAKKVFCVWNCSRKEEVLPAPEEKEAGRLVCIYQGSIVPQRLPLTIIDALEKLPRKFKVIVVGYEGGQGGYMKKFLARAREAGLASQIDFKGVLKREELLPLTAQCHLGFSLMPMETRDINLKYMVGASNKVFEYLSSRVVPLLSNLPEWKEIFVKKGYALDCDPRDPDSIAKALAWALDHPQEMEEMSRRGQEKILSQWNYENQFERIKKLMEDKSISRSRI